MHPFEIADFVIQERKIHLKFSFELINLEELDDSLERGKIKMKFKFIKRYKKKIKKSIKKVKKTVRKMKKQIFPNSLERSELLA